MKKELDEALVRDFPLLFSDRFGSMHETCMCWGFPGDGWEPIIREAAEKLEPLIQKYIDEISTEYKDCICGEHITMHENCSGRCTKVYYLPRGEKLRKFLSNKSRYAIQCGVYNSKALKDRLYVSLIKTKSWLFSKMHRCASRFFDFLVDANIAYIELPSTCDKFRINHPRASQLKEKYGTLRFYMTSGTKEMFDICNEAERKSAYVCEFCGAPGKLRRGGWLLTLCNACNDVRNKGQEQDEDDDD
jgi:ribosomal protein L37AE/L43A